jgi:hypothetical protein
MVKKNLLQMRNGNVGGRSVHICRERERDEMRWLMSWCEWWQGTKWMDAVIVCLGKLYSSHSIQQGGEAQSPNFGKEMASARKEEFRSWYCGKATAGR